MHRMGISLASWLSAASVMLAALTAANRLWDETEGGEVHRFGPGVFAWQWRPHHERLERVVIQGAGMDRTLLLTVTEPRDPFRPAPQGLLETHRTLFDLVLRDLTLCTRCVRSIDRSVPVLRVMGLPEQPRTQDFRTPWVYWRASGGSLELDGVRHLGPSPLCAVALHRAIDVRGTRSVFRGALGHLSAEPLLSSFVSARFEGCVFRGWERMPVEQRSTFRACRFEASPAFDERSWQLFHTLTSCEFSAENPDDALPFFAHNVLLTWIRRMGVPAPPPSLEVRVRGPRVASGPATARGSR